jgi:hypothetical protein
MFQLYPVVGTAVGGRHALFLCVWPREFLKLRSTVFGTFSPRTRLSDGFSGKFCTAPVQVAPHATTIVVFFFPVALTFPLYFGFAFLFQLMSARVLGVSRGFWVCGFFGGGLFRASLSV